MTPLHAAALAWAEAGFHVFPLIPGGKEPFDGSNGHLEATTNIDTINQWWAQWPDANIGCAPDKSGHVVIDPDPPLGEQTLRGLSALPETYVVRTPRGGRHLWFIGKCKSTVGTELRGLGPNVDTRGIGGYVVVPPSIVNGKPYVVEDDKDFADLPAWVTEKLAVSIEGRQVAADVELDLPVNIDRAIASLKRHVDSGDISVAGSGGNNTLFRIAANILDMGISDGGCHYLICEHFNPHCQPPWSENEISRVIENAQSYRQNDVGAYAVKPLGELFADKVAAWLASRTEVSAMSAEPAGVYTPKRISELQDVPAPEWWLEDFLPKRGLVVIYGQRKSFKSFLMLDIALGLVTGTRTFGMMPTATCDVVYTVGEGQANLVRKHVPAWHQINPETNIDQFFVVDKMPKSSRPETMEAFIKDVRKVCPNPGLVVIDTMARALGGDENSFKDVDLFREDCDVIREQLGCTVVVIRHSGKDMARGARGIQVVEDASDTVIEVVRHEKSLAVKVIVRDQRGAGEGEDPFYFEGHPRMTPAGKSLTFHQIDARGYMTLIEKDSIISKSAVYKALTKLGTVTTAVLASELAVGRDVDADKLARLLAKMAKPGHPLEVYFDKDAGTWSKD